MSTIDVGLPSLSNGSNQQRRFTSGSGVDDARSGRHHHHHRLPVLDVTKTVETFTHRELTESQSQSSIEGLKTGEV